MLTHTWLSSSLNYCKDFIGFLDLLISSLQNILAQCPAGETPGAVSSVGCTDLIPLGPSQGSGPLTAAKADLHQAQVRCGSRTRCTAPSLFLCGMGRRILGQGFHFSIKPSLWQNFHFKSIWCLEKLSPSKHSLSIPILRLPGSFYARAKPSASAKSAQL